MRYVIVTATALVLCGCSTEAPREPFPKLAEEFVYTTLANSPVFATSKGYHQHGNLRLDAILDDYSPGSIERQRRWYQDFRLRLQRSVDRASLSSDESADYDLLQDQISLALLELTTIQDYRHNPTVYVELIGSGLYAPYVLEYADKSQRFEHIIGRLNAVPALLEQARRNLRSAPEIWNSVAREENAGTIGLIERTLRDNCPQQLRPRYDEAVKEAVLALRDFSDWLANDLAARTYDWRLGRDLYAQKFRYVLATDQSPDQVLAAAEADMRHTREQMYEIAKKITGSSGGETNAVIRRALDSIASRHATPETYFVDARRDLEEAREFVKRKNLLTLPPRDNLQVIETPEFMRGIYAVGGFSPAPALEPHLGAFYWLTPIPSTWPKERIESKLREYNYYGLKLLTIHEAIPGHYVQLEYANDIQPPLRRMLRAVFGNGPYVEGWAVYATEMMLDQGYLDNDPALRLTFLKQQFRVFANAILDVRLQTMGMTDRQAIDLMVNDAFQEREEAEAKLQRAKLSSTQLPTYYAGWRDWRRLRATSAGQDLREFHERALKAGALPLPVLSRLMTGKRLTQSGF
jgi:uncharacterized protein (DUF885 family)